ncbi:MAG: signal peptide peptidase SppA, partial [Polyangia bacterium]
MEKRSALTAVLVFGGLLGLCFAFFYLIFASLDSGEREAGWGGGLGPKVGVVDVTGVITESREVLGQLHELRKDKSISAIVVRIDSPGGSVAPSQEIFHAIERARKDKKVVCSMGTVAASGGYYIAAACDKIVASAGTVTGSIGVISEMPHVHKLLELVRVDIDTIKSGAMKDVGSPFRPMTPEEKQFFQQFVDGVYDQFLSDVAKSRGLDKEKLRKIADGRILTGAQALDAKLVDQLGNLEDALELAVKLADTKGEPVPVFRK